MAKRVVIIQGHPDPSEHHLLHAMADAYAEGAGVAGHEVRRIEVAKLQFPLLRTQLEFESGSLPSALIQPSDDMRWADHWVFLFPLWHGTMPALLKGFLEQIFRPGFAMEYKRAGFPKRLLAGHSARIVVTLGMPVLLYRWYSGAYGLRSVITPLPAGRQATGIVVLLQHLDVVTAFSRIRSSAHASSR